MLKRGCWKAYALDGGQTATTVFGGQLINPVQFGQEKEIRGQTSPVIVDCIQNFAPYFVGCDRIFQKLY